MRHTLTLTAATVLAWAALATHAAAVDARSGMVTPSEVAQPQPMQAPVAQERPGVPGGVDGLPAGALLFGVALWMAVRLVRYGERAQRRSPDATGVQRPVQQPIAAHEPERTASAAPSIVDRRRRTD